MDGEEKKPAADMKKMVAVAAIGAGVEFGWAIQLSLLTPYVQQLGVPHKWAPLFWFAGPFAGMVVQPILGFFSDRSSSRFGRRRPFLAAYVSVVSLAAFLMAFAADLGHRRHNSRAVTISIFGIGDLLLECGNIAIYTHCAAFLGDLTAGNPKRARTASSLFSFFMAVGGVLGYAAGLYTHLYKIFPFALTDSCDIYCANLKSCLILAITILVATSVFTLWYVPDKATNTTTATTDGARKLGIWREMKEVKRPMWMLLMVTFMNWAAWFPFMLYNTDWMGREIYGGDDNGGGDHSKKVYDAGVRMGALGLMLNAVVQGITSLGAEWMGRKMGGANRLWGAANFGLGVCLGMTALVTRQPALTQRTTGALLLFALLGFPMAVTFCVPFAMAAILSTEHGVGQAFTMGLVNFAILMPQMVISVGAGPFDEAFGGGNLPAFVGGAILALISAVMAFFLLPSSSSSSSSPPPSDTASTA
ncbi:PREDICTED: sucrose transport protein SUC2-like [Tarenaya hassleriana]|uniref:sucrose transport protein SUC2-like n=1 Tax=Tarenaya hassleriana TaxID=28532 RepID=UPI00053C9160|nr:PREDICTED: sucrose transport protein SUC2-like [Tarenaya hassleriana]